MSRRPYIRPMSKTTWYMRNGRYKVYMLREMTSLLVAFYTCLTLCALAALASNSAQTWNGFLAWQQSTAMITLHGFSLLYFLFFQTFPWFKLAPKAMVIQLGEKQVPGSFIIIGHYVAWLVICAIIFRLTGAV